MARTIPRPRASDYEGSTLVEVVDSGGNVLLRALTDEEAASLGRPRTHCGTAHGGCCHPLGLEEEGVFRVIGKVEGGRIGDKPLRDWIPRIQEDA